MILLFVSVPAGFSVPRDRKRREDTHIRGTAKLFTLCPAYIKHALLLQLEQKGKQCHQVKFLRIPQTPQQIDLSSYQIEGSTGKGCSINSIYVSKMRDFFSPLSNTY